MGRGSSKARGGGATIQGKDFVSFPMKPIRELTLKLIVGNPKKAE